MDKRPDLNKDISLKDFADFYWLKSELVDFCKTEGLSTAGAKLEIAKRIEHYLKTGDKIISIKKTTALSKFDWSTEGLSLSTMITDNYKNTQNVREFFEKEIGSNFKFNVDFMNWIKLNTGKTLGDAVLEYHKILDNKSKITKKEIAPQFEYNTYLRDFLLDNPQSNRETGIKLWNIKRNLRGDNIYRKSDLDLLNN